MTLCITLVLHVMCIILHVKLGFLRGWVVTYVQILSTVTTPTCLGSGTECSVISPTYRRTILNSYWVSLEGVPRRVQGLEKVSLTELSYTLEPLNGLQSLGEQVTQSLILVSPKLFPKVPSCHFRSEDVCVIRERDRSLPPKEGSESPPWLGSTGSHVV